MIEKKTTLQSLEYVVSELGGSHSSGNQIVELQ